MFYTYLWLRDDGTPYYVGKGKGNRAFENTNRKVTRRPKDRTRILIQEFPSEADAFAAEAFLIQYYGRKDLQTGCLQNRTSGGEGSSGRKQSTECKRKISLGCKNSPRNKGKHHSAETKVKMRLSHVGRKYITRRMRANDNRSPQPIS